MAKKSKKKTVLDALRKVLKAGNCSSLSKILNNLLMQSAIKNSMNRLEVGMAILEIADDDSIPEFNYCTIEGEFEAIMRQA